MRLDRVDAAFRMTAKLAAGVVSLDCSDIFLVGGFTYFFDFHSIYLGK